MKIVSVIIILAYTIFAVYTFIKVSKYDVAGLYFIAITVAWFKIRKKLI